MKLKYYKAKYDDKETLQWQIKYNGFAIAVTMYQWLIEMLHSLLTKSGSYKYEVAVCLIFKNEAKYLREWIEYYLLIGVDHFYLYNNFSDDEYQIVLKPYIEQGIVTLIEWPYQYAQVEAYTDCYKRFNRECHWLGYLDADEFVNIHQHDDLKTLLKSYRKHASVLFQWRMFGTSGHLEEDYSQLVTERYVSAWPYLVNVGKSFINNDFRFSKIWVHEHVAKYMGFPLFPVNDCHLPTPKNTTLWKYLNIGRKAWINHYFSKSYEWFIYKDFKRGDALSVDNEKIKAKSNRFKLHELNNTVRDYSIQRFIVLLKKCLQN